MLSGFPREQQETIVRKLIAIREAGQLDDFLLAVADLQRAHGFINAESELRMRPFDADLYADTAARLFGESANAWLPASCAAIGYGRETLRPKVLALIDDYAHNAGSAETIVNIHAEGISVHEKLKRERMRATCNGRN